MENKSILRLIVSFIEDMVIQCQVIIMCSVFEYINSINGIRLRKKEYFIELIT